MEDEHMGPKEDSCENILRSGPKGKLDICGDPAKWRASDGWLLCDKHKDELLDQQPDSGVEPISE